MLTNYLKIAVRNLLKQKTFSFINIFGLALSMGVCLLVIMFDSCASEFFARQPDTPDFCRPDSVVAGAVPAGVVALVGGGGPDGGFADGEGGFAGPGEEFAE